MNDERAPDEALRRRLLFAAEREAESGPVDAAERHARIAARMTAAAPAYATRRRRLRYALGSAVAVAAAGLLAFVGFHERAMPAAPRCTLPTTAPMIARSAAAQRLDLGAHGDVLAADATRFRVLSASACELRIEVSHGALALDVHELAPARIVLTSPHGDVVVRGTQFSVDVGDELAVHLISGTLDVAAGDTHQALRAGETLTQSRAHPGAPQLRPVSENERREVRRLLSLRGAFVGPKISSAKGMSSPPVAGVQLLPEVVFDAPPVAASAATRDVLRSAEEARQRGDNNTARRLYERASRGRRPDAEVALLRWARFELADGQTQAALGLLARHRGRFARGALGAEAGWLAVSVYRARGESEPAQRAAERLVLAFPGTPQAAAARRLVDAP